MKLFRRTPTTSNAMSIFNEALTELEAVVANESRSIEALDAEIAAKIDAQTAAKERSAEADRFAKRIRKMVA